VIIKPGAKGNPWWDTNQLLTRVERAIDIQDKPFGSNVDAVFGSDQSSAHASYGDGALNSFDMSKSDECKVAVWYKDTTVPTDALNVEMRDKVQSLRFGEQLKGTKRGKCNPRCMETAVDCCFARILHNQQDFEKQRSALKNPVVAREHLVVFLPKFHCECNPIEMYWGYSKCLYMVVKKGILGQADKEAVKALEGIGLDRIKR
jgi:hypothetical protein